MTGFDRTGPPQRVKVRLTNMDKQSLAMVWDAKTDAVVSNRCKAVDGPGINEGQRMFLDGYKAFTADGTPVILSTVPDE